MPATPDDVLSLVLFARVVEARSFTAAAQRLGVSKSVASARVSQLEQRLGTRLLQRTTRKLALTSDGLALYERAARIAAEADQATALAAGASAEPRGVLRVSAPVSFAQLYLTAPIAAYLERFARVRVELRLADQLVDLVAEGVDVAIRISAGLRDSSLVGKKLAEDRTIVCASPAYLARKGTPAVPADLIHHDCIRYSLLKPADEWRFRADGKSFAVPVEARFEAGSGSVLREAALAGIGVAVLPSFMVAQDLAAGGLQQVLAPYTFVRLSIHAVYPSAGVLPANVRAFVAVLAESLRIPPWSAATTSPQRATGKRSASKRGARQPAPR